MVFCGPTAVQALRSHISLLPETAQVDTISPAQYDSIAIAVGGDGSGVYCFDGVLLGFEGYVTHTLKTSEALFQQLIGDFLAKGADCVKGWQGSFRAVIHYQGISWVFTDQLATRALFFVQTDNLMGYCAHRAPLMSFVDKREVDGANLLQFLNTGRFFSGSTLFKGLKLFTPGVGHKLASGGISCVVETFQWFEYRLHNLDIALDDALPQLKLLLDEAILSHWQKARTPALLLSGGVDSRYILNTLSELVAPHQLQRLHTCLWGEINDHPQSDSAWAAAEAQRVGVEFSFYPNQGDVAGLFEQMMLTQSGMTAHVFSHTDDFYWCRHLATMGFGTLIRGDEIFGPNGGPVENREAALTKVGVNYLPHELPGFSVDINQWQQSHRAHVDFLAEQVDEPNDLRDVLYCRERLPALNSHLNAQRAPFVENFNPLLAMPIVELVATLPRHLRTNKLIFRRCFERYYPTDGFASCGNGFDWQRLWQQKSMSLFVLQQLEQLTGPFDSSYWLQLGRLLALPHGSEQHMKLLQTAIRAIVLNHWLNEVPCE